jgi:hypothetical protein
MRRADAIKLILSVCAALSLGWGIRTDQTAYRWVGIACLVMAVLLRFIRPRTPLN